MTRLTPKAILKALREWLETDSVRRAGKDAHPYERGWEDGWDAAREKIREITEISEQK